jgi:hypothetical protein
VRLSALVETSDGGLIPVGRLVADPSISSVITTDLLDPRRYLSGGELVLTGLAWWRPDRPGRSRTFVAALVDGAAAAVAAGEAELGGVPDDLIEACAEADLPLLRVPVAFAFASVTERAMRQLSGRDDVAAVLARHRALMAAASSGSGLAGVLELVRADLDLRCWVLSAAGRLVAGVEPLPDEPERNRLAREFLRAPRLPHTVVRTGRRTVSIFVVGSDQPRVASWLLAVDSDHTTWNGARQAVLSELASLVAVEHDLARQPSDMERQLAAALDRGSVPEIESFMDTSRSTVVVTGRGALADVVLREADVQWLGDGLALSTVDSPDEVVSRLRDTVARLEPGLGPAPVRIGVSDAVTGGAGLVAALAEAKAAAAIEAGTPHSVTGPERLSSHALLLGAVPAELREAYRARVLGPLMEHDRAHRSDLVGTLRAYLDSSGSWSRCAAQMHVHVNTLRYRIERIEALTGRDLRRLSDQADLLLALDLPSRHPEGLE